MAVVAVDVTITGMVQGVFFRARTEEQAARLGVSGWVTNQADGSVAAHFEGAPDAVDALVSWCRTGPPRAHVDDVQLTEAEPSGASSFEVR